MTASDKTRDEVLRLYFDEGLSLRQVARRIASTNRTVAAVIRRAGRELRPPRTPAGHVEKKKDLILRLYFDEGLSSHAIAGRLGCTAPAVLGVIRRAWRIPRCRGSSRCSEATRSRIRRKMKERWADPVWRRRQIARIHPALAALTPDQRREYDTLTGHGYRRAEAFRAMGLPESGPVIEAEASQ